MIGPYYITNETRRMAAWGQPGTAGRGGNVTLVTVRLDGRTFKVNDLAQPAFGVYEQIRAEHGYTLTGTDTGFYSYRHMRHDNSMPWSVHAWAMALDINWLENPAGDKLVTDIPQAMIDDLLAVRTVSGARVFRWGGDWDWDGISTDHSYVDAMHWECVAHPLDLATGINHVEDTVFLPIREGDGIGDKTAKRSDVAVVQAKLNRLGAGLTTDGRYGATTKAAVVKYLGTDGSSVYGSLYEKLDWLVIQKASNGGNLDLEALAEAVANDLQIVPKT